MIGGRIINEAEARALVEIETGISFQRGTLVHYVHDELVAAGSFIGQHFVLFGTLCINGYDPTNCFIEFQCANKTTLYIAPAANLNPVNNGNLHHNLIIDGIATLLYCQTTFWGYLFERQMGWVKQVANLTPGAGWSNSGTSYTHVSGTTEQIYLGAWTVSSKLRVTITFTGITAGNVRLQMDSSGTFATITANGTYTFEVTTTSMDGALFITPSNTFNGTYDNATFKVEKLTYI